MPKRKNTEKIQYYESKIQKLKEKQRCASVVSGRRRIILSDSSSDDNSGIGTPFSRGESHETVEDIVIHEPTQVIEQPPIVEAVVTLVTDESGVSQPNEATEENLTTLDPDIIQALGTKTSEKPEYGEKIHDNLAQLWQPLLKKGLSKEEKESALKQYLVPQNCTLLQAPRLNLEISAALTESARNKDKKIAAHQQQLGQGITAVNRAMDIMLLNKDDEKLTAIKHLSNACRILCDLHQIDSQIRVKLISPSLDKSFINVIQDCQRDDSLFGTNLSEKIKSTKAIEKQGLQIKKLTPTGPAPAAPAARPGPSRGNWRAPPRYPASSRGTRGGYRRAPPARRQAPPPPPQTRQASRQQQPRAPPQQ